MATLDIITIGTATRDVFIESKLFKVLHDPKHLERLGFKTGEAQCFALGAKIEVGRPTLAFGGGAMNAAVTFGRQGFKTGALITIGDDENGDAILGALAREKVASLAAIDRKKGTAYSVILLSPSGERTILAYRGASEDLSKREVAPTKLQAKAAYVVPGAIPLPVIAGAVRALKKRGALIAMNPSAHYLSLGAKKLAPLLRAIDVIIMNREEAAYLTGEKFEHERKIFKKFDRMVPGLAVMTDGPNGVMVSDGKTIYAAGVYPDQKVMNRTGAGDAFGSGFVAGLLQYGATPGKVSDDAVRYAIRLASANATGVVEGMGAQAGILTKHRFETERRWRDFKITARSLE